MYVNIYLLETWIHSLLTIVSQIPTIDIFHTGESIAKKEKGG